MGEKSHSPLDDVDYLWMIAEHATELISRHTLAGHFTQVSPACRRLLGFESKELIGKHFCDLVHADDLSKIRILWSVLGQRSRTANMTCRFVDKGGRTLWMETTATSVPGDGEGELREIIAVSRDVTRRHHMEVELRHREEQFRTLVEQSPVSIQILDPRGRTLQVNRAWMDLWGLSMDDLENYNILEDPQLKSLGIHEPIRRAFGGESMEIPVARYDAERTLGKGRKRWVGGRAYPVFDPDGSLRNVILMHEDLTEKKLREDEQRKLESQVQQTQKLESLGVLAGGIAHDFNNLLVGILGNAGLALLEMSPTSPARNTIANIETAARRAAELCRQLLAYSGKGKFLVEPLNLTELVEEMSHLLEVSIAKNVVLKFKLDRQLPAVNADATQMRQIVMNLITNASEAIGEKSGVVNIVTGVQECDRNYLRETYLDKDVQEGTYVFLEVSDTGCGMDKKTLAKIFDPFFTTKFTGRGLGLAAVLGIVRSHKGAVKVYSEPDKGTTFKLLLPAMVRVSPPQSLPVEKAAVQIATGTVLVADDEPTVREVASRALQKTGLQVIAVPDGRSAIDAFRQRADDIDLVILDMTMPRLGGEETFRELRKIRKDVRVILTSGYNEHEAMVGFQGKGLAGFIQKPWHPAQLMELVTRCLRDAADKAPSPDAAPGAFHEQ
ncbi:MAG: PAS domain S-box protein [Planctomycetota bacterium]